MDTGGVGSVGAVGLHGTETPGGDDELLGGLVYLPTHSRPPDEWRHEIIAPQIGLCEGWRDTRRQGEGRQCDVLFQDHGIGSFLSVLWCGVRRLETSKGTRAQNSGQPMYCAGPGASSLAVAGGELGRAIGTITPRDRHHCSHRPFLREKGRKVTGFLPASPGSWLAIWRHEQRTWGSASAPAQSHFWKVRSCSHRTSGLPGEGMPSVNFRGEIMVSFTKGGRVRGSSHLCGSA